MLQVPPLLHTRSTPDVRSLERRSATPQGLPEWKKLLYLKQPYPDNYTDQSFLSQMTRNETIATHSYLKLVDDFSLIVFHLSSLLLVVFMFVAIYHYHWSSSLTALISTVFTALGFGLVSLMKDTPKQAASAGNFSFKSYLLIVFTVLILSPILKSLTRSTSSDSIWALSFILCIASTSLHNYGMNTAPATMNPSITSNEYRPILSNNISMSNSIVLASRLTTTPQVFFFILFAIHTNLLLPIYDYNIRKMGYHNVHRLIFFSLFSGVNYLIVTILGIKLLLLWWVCVACIVFALPAYFLFLQRYKNELLGPWDHAKPRINKA